MAKQRKIVTNARRQNIVAGYAERRAELQGVIASSVGTADGRETTGAP